jgi:hypothetical protein
MENWRFQGTSPRVKRKFCMYNMQCIDLILLHAPYGYMFTVIFGPLTFSIQWCMRDQIIFLEKLVRFGLATLADS